VNTPRDHRDLPELIKHKLKHDPFSGTLYIFFGIASALNSGAYKSLCDKKRALHGLAR